MASGEVGTAASQATSSPRETYLTGGTSWSFLAGSGLSETAAGVTVSLGWRAVIPGSAGRLPRPATATIFQSIGRTTSPAVGRI